MKYFALYIFLIFGTAVFAQESDIENMINDWHNAAAEADFDRYFGHFADSSSIFMGTDATERWNVAQFMEYSKPHFEAGRAWDFTPVTRHVMVGPNGLVAWFDEELDTPNLGPSRGTGVVIFDEGEWKIAHYSLTIPIPNAIVYDIKEQIEKSLRDGQ